MPRRRLLTRSLGSSGPGTSTASPDRTTGGDTSTLLAIALASSRPPHIAWRNHTIAILLDGSLLQNSAFTLGRVLAAEYQGQAGTFHAFWWQKPGSEAGARHARRLNRDERGQTHFFCGTDPIFLSATRNHGKRGLSL